MAKKRAIQNEPKPKRKIASEDLPRKTLEEALRVAQVIKNDYAGSLATWDDIAKSLGFSPTNPNNQYFLWAATSYGIIEKTDNSQFRLTEIGRKILAPTFDNEDREGKILAIGKPAILARFYSDYASSQLPSGEIFRNVLEQKYSIPNARLDECIQLILQNAKFAGLLEDLPMANFACDLVTLPLELELQNCHRANRRTNQLFL